LEVVLHDLKTWPYVKILKLKSLVQLAMGNSEFNNASEKAYLLRRNVLDVVANQLD